MFRILVGIGSLQILSVLVTFVRAKAAALLVGPEGLGIISVIDQTIQFVAHTSALSLPFATVKFLSKAHSEGEGAFRQGYALFFSMLLVLSAIGATVAAGLALFRIDLFPSELTPYSVLLAIGCLGIPGTVLTGFFPNVLAAAQQATGSARLTLSVSLIVALGSITGLMMGGLTGLYIGSTAAVTLVACAAGGYLWRMLRLTRTRASAWLSFEGQQVREVICFSVLFYATALTSIGSLLVARYVTLQHFGEAQAGFLQAGMAVALLMNGLLNPLNGLFLMPKVNRTAPKAEKFATSADFQKQLLLIVTVLALPVILFPHIILMTAFSSQFLVVAPSVYLFVLWQALANLAGIYQALLIGLDDMAAYTGLTCLGNVLTACAALLLIPRFGIQGAAIGFAAASGFLLFVTYLRLRLSHGFAVPTHLMSLLNYSVLLIVGLGGLFRNAGEWDSITILSKLGAGLLAMGGLLLFIGKTDKLALSTISHKVWSRT